ncbi:sensor histidine kinase [Roseateles sp.]|uniref:sensor histidine kinase n=1 Tax=Roseateles sp. TaxID=1971397 RepID=UPI003BA57F9E
MNTSYRPRLQQRMMLAFAGFTLLVSAVFGLFAMAFVYTVEDEFFNSALRQEAQRQAAARAAEGGELLQPAQDFIRLYRPGQALPEDLAQARQQEPNSRELAGLEGRHYHLLSLDADGSLLVAEVSGQLVVRPMRQKLLRWLGLWGGGLTLLALGLAWWMARRTSAPLARLARAVAQSRPEQLPTDLAPHYGQDEVGQLARYLDDMNQRVAAFIEREQSFTRDASHELRTPLAVLSLSCERLHSQPRTAGLPELASMRAAIWQLQQTVELLLALARQAPSQPLLQAATQRPLLPQVEQAVLAFAPLLDQQQITLTLEVSPSLSRDWPPALTQLLLSNLLGNALAHGQGGRINISASAEELRLCNPSPRPPLALLQADGAGQQLGVKGEASAGLGLGLSIVRRLAERHGLQLQLSHDGDCTCVSLRSAP